LIRVVNRIGNSPGSTTCASLSFMLTIKFKIHGHLATLPPHSWLVTPTRENGPALLVRHLTAPTTVKDFLEAAGIPHCEIGPVTAAGRPAGLDFLLAEDLKLEVIPPVPRPLPEARFICDAHLGALARRLRMLGFDTLWKVDWLEPEIVRRALNEQRAVLSRSRALLKRKELDLALLIRSDRPDEQVAEVLARFQVADRIRLFGRCTVCNGVVEPVAKEKVRDRIPPRTRLWLDDYYLCRDCGRLYWEGTHMAAIRQRLAAVIPLPDRPPPPPRES